jgi:hypothetical protein
VKLTNEHVFARSLYSLFSGSGDGASLTAYYHDQAVRPMRGFDYRVRVVCEECNHGWSHDLESAFRGVMAPAITGQAAIDGVPIRLGLSARQTVATWATKTWLLLELATESVRGGAVASDDAARHLHARSRPPEEVHVFIGTVEPDARDIASFRTVRFVADDAIVAFAGMFWLGKLLCYVLAPIKLSVEKTLGVARSGQAASSLVQIWPHEVTEVGWPTSPILTMGMVDQIARPRGSFGCSSRSARLAGPVPTG